MMLRMPVAIRARERGKEYSILVPTGITKEDLQ